MLLIFSLSAPALAASDEVYEKTPLIYIRDNGATMYTPDEKPVKTGYRKKQ